MRKWIAAMIAIMMLTAGCGSDEHEHMLHPAQPTEVTLNMQPEEPSPGDQVTFSVTVLQDGAPVNDADEVKLELWKDGQERHETIPATKSGDGVYSAATSFAEPGTYHVMYHVNARDFHNMKEQTFTVKGQEAPANHSHHSSGSGHHHGGEVEFHFEPEMAKAAQQTTLTVQLTADHQPLTQATVIFEYWKSGEENHQFVAASEESAGKYAAQAVFSSPGTYTVKVHVEKGTIHDHKEYTLTIQ